MNRKNWLANKPRPKVVIPSLAHKPVIGNIYKNIMSGSIYILEKIETTFIEGNKPIVNCHLLLYSESGLSSVGQRHVLIYKIREEKLNENWELVYWDRIKEYTTNE